MSGVRKRFVKAVAVLLAGIFLSFCACADDTPDYSFKTYDCFSVNFLDVGEGDAIFINFNDGKTMLIDCGAAGSANLKTAKRYIDAYSDGKLDYFLLTHTDYDHVGNAAALIEEYVIDTAFIPDLNEPYNFPYYYAAYEKLCEKNVTQRVSAVFQSVFGDNYTLMFLSPNAKGTTDSAYDAINAADDPPASARNDVSPIIYLEYKGVRFLFMGDAGFSQEAVSLANVRNGLIDRVLSSKGKSAVNLANIDFLKVSHHGAFDACGAEFLSVITPKNAVISVGGDNYYGHPSSETLSRIYDANENCKVYSTSIYGTVSVLVGENGEVSVVTDKRF